jgi:hypothetical protein
MPSVYNYLPNLTKNRGILRRMGLKKNSQKPIINNTLKLKNNNTESIPETIASTASFATTLENYDSEFENNNPKINTNEINIFINKFVNTEQIPELNGFKNQWRTSFTDIQKKEFIKRIKNIVESEDLLRYLQNYNKNIGKNNDTRFMSVLKLLDLLIQGHNRNRYESVERNYSNNRNKFENLIYKLKHINYTPGNTSTPQFTSAANQIIKYQLNRSKLQINKLDNKQKNELIFFLLDNKSFKNLLDTLKPTKKDYFTWVDTTFGI